MASFQTYNPFPADSLFTKNNYCQFQIAFIQLSVKTSARQEQSSKKLLSIYPSYRFYCPERIRA